MNRWHTADMDLIERTRTIQADRQRQIEQETRRRRLFEVAAMPPTRVVRSTGPDAPSGRPGQPFPAASSPR